MLSCVWKSKKALALGFEISTENVNPPTPKTPLLVKMSQLLLPRGSTPGHLLGTHGEWHSLGISFFPLGEGRFFSFGNDFAGSRGHTHGICSTFAHWYIARQTKVFSRHFISFRCQISIYHVVGVHTSLSGRAICH